MDHETQAKGIPSCTFLPCRMAFIIMRISTEKGFSPQYLILVQAVEAFTVSNFNLLDPPLDALQQLLSYFLYFNILA